MAKDHGMEDMMSKTTGSKPANQEPAEKIKLPIKAIAAAAAVLVIIVALLIAEAVNSNRYSIKNNTGTDIESIAVYFENEDEDYYYRSDDLMEISVAAGEKAAGSFEKQSNVLLYGSSMMIRVKFAGREEVLTYTGYFTNAFNGKIKLVFEDDKENPGNITLAVKAGEGLFQSTSHTNCDETQDLFLED